MANMPMNILIIGDKTYEIIDAAARNDIGIIQTDIENIKENKLGKNENAISATKAVQDGNGKVIADTYATKEHGHTAGDITSGKLSIAVGGTGATTKEEALDNLGAAPLNHNHSANNINSGTLSSDRLPTVPISKGGTGAASAVEALAALGGAKASNHQISQFISMSTLGLESVAFSETDLTANVKTLCDAMDSLGGVEQDKFVMPFASTHAISQSVFAKILNDLGISINCYIDFVIEKYNASTVQVYVYLQGSNYRGTCFYCMCDISDSAKTTKFIYAHHPDGFMVSSQAMSKANFSFDAATGTLNITL